MLLAALVLLAAEPAELAPRDPASQWRTTLSLGGGVSPDGGDVGGGFEVGLMVLRFLRLQVDAGAHWSPGPGNDSGIVRLLAGVDGVLPLPKSELFVGLESGVVYSNFSRYSYYGGPPCLDCFFPQTQWQWGPALKVRSGVDLLFWSPLVIGASVSYAFIAVSQFENYHFAEFALRVGALF